MCWHLSWEVRVFFSLKVGREEEKEGGKGERDRHRHTLGPPRLLIPYFRRPSLLLSPFLTFGNSCWSALWSMKSGHDLPCLPRLSINQACELQLQEPQGPAKAPVQTAVRAFRGVGRDTIQIIERINRNCAIFKTF